MATPAEGGADHEGPLAEFTALRQEILQRTNHQQQLMTLQLTISGAIFGFSLVDRNRLGLLLILPFSTYVLFCRYQAHHGGIYDIATYIREVLNGAIPGGVQWEQWLERHVRVRPAGVGWPEPLLVTFPGISILALTWLAPRLFFESWTIAFAQRLGLIVAWVLGLAATVATIQLMWRFRRRWWLRTWSPQDRNAPM